MLRKIPSVNDLLETAPIKSMLETATASRTAIVHGVRTFLDDLRKDIQSSAEQAGIPTPNELAERIADWIAHQRQSKLRPVINATGVVLHTGLGRAPWPRAAIDAAAAIAEGYCSLEVDLGTGKRSQRAQAVESLLTELTGAEAATVVNNNAAATMLALAAVATGKEVIVSRGQLVEIGGSYRLPEVMTYAGVKLREVGATNKSRISDYRNAVNLDTAALMRVHTSNYTIVGFTEEASLEELVTLGRKRNLPVIDDIGSGALIDYARFGFTGEPVARKSIEAGADLVLFSGDKLLGGPQCGIVLGRRELVARIVAHPLMRAVRVDKTVLAALAATLRLYEDADIAVQQVPLLAMLDAPLANLQHRAERLAEQIAALASIQSAVAREEVGLLGGGSLPNQRAPTWCVALEPRGRSTTSLAAALRAGEPAVFGRVQQEQLLIDLRTVAPREDQQIVTALHSLGDHR